MAVRAQGTRATLFAREQSNFATAEAQGQTGKFWTLPFYEYSSAPDLPRENDDAIEGQGFLPGPLVAGLERNAVSCTMPMGVASLGVPLKSMFGAPTTTGSTDLTHVFKASATGAYLPFTYGVSFNDVATHFRDEAVVINRMQVRAEMSGARARVTFDGVSRAHSKRAAAMDTAPVSFTNDAVPVQFICVVQRDGVAITAGIMGVTATVSNGVDLDMETINGAATADDALQGIWSAEGTIEARLTDATWYDLAAAGTPFSLKLLWSISTGTGAQRAIFTFDDVQLVKSAPIINGRGLVTQSYTWKAGKPAGANQPCTVQIQNQTANYNRIP